MNNFFKRRLILFALLCLTIPIKSFSQCGAVQANNQLEMVTNGSFEQNIFHNSTQIQACTIGTIAGTCNTTSVRNWCGYSRFHTDSQAPMTPDYIVRNPANGGLSLPVIANNGIGTNGSRFVETHNSNNNAYVHIVSGTNRGVISEGISTQLRTPIVPGQFYRASLWVYVDNNSENIPIHFYFHNNYDLSSPQVLLSNTFTAIARNVNNPNYNWNNYFEWERIEVTFQFPADAAPGLFTHMGIEADPAGSFFIDDVSLVQTCPTSVNAGPDVTFCQNSGTVTLTASGANTYTWTGSNGSIYSGQTIYVSPSVTTTYEVLGANAAGCQSTDQVTVTVIAQPNISVAPTNISVCQGEPVTINVSGANSYTWRYNSTPIQVQNPSPNTFTFIPTASGNYWVKGIGANGCPSVETRILINVRPAPSDVDAGTDKTICLGEGIQLQATGGTNSTYPVTYTWSPAIGLNTTSGANVIASPTTTTTYTVTASVTYNGFTCSKTDQVVVNVNKPTDFSVALSWPYYPSPIPSVLHYCDRQLMFDVTPNVIPSTITGTVLYRMRTAPHVTWTYPILANSMFLSPYGQTPNRYSYYADAPCYTGGLDLEITINVNNNLNCGTLTKKVYTYVPDTPFVPGNTNKTNSTYPNPASEYLIIESQKTGNYSLYDGFGKEVLNGSLNKEKNRINTKNLKKGLYFLHIINGKEVEKQQIIIE